MKWNGSKNMYLIEQSTEDIVKNKRIEYIDIARGIAIILMVFGHLGFLWNIQPVRNAIYSFHMPLFIIISGLFFNEKDKLKDLLKKIGKKLLLPYIVTIVITNLLYSIVHKEEFILINLIKQTVLASSNYLRFAPEIASVNQLWFITFLAMIRILFYTINKICNNDIQKGIVCLLFTIEGMVLAKISIFLPWSLDIALATIIFYYVGYIIKKYNCLEKIINTKIVLCVFIVIWYARIR